MASLSNEHGDVEVLRFCDTLKVQRTDSIHGFCREYKELRASQPDDFIAPHTKVSVHGQFFTLIIEMVVPLVK